jgi:5-methylcytosine-specific restriction enzyme subunit McrC
VNTVQVREYATLTCCRVDRQPSLDFGIVTPATFDWLLELQRRWSSKKSQPLALENRNSIKLGSYVGFLQSPSGQCIEVLPKTQLQRQSDEETANGRNLLRDMILTALRLKPREADFARLQRMKTPLHEWIISEFLAELTTLVHRGLRFDYQNVEEESRFVRGKLDQVRQLRQTPSRAVWFHIRHDVYSPNRVENRLLRTALGFVLTLSTNPNNLRVATELVHQLIEIEPYNNPAEKLHLWQQGKLMQSYRAIKPWCELIIEKLNPNFQKGQYNGIALLYPMEKLFEGYVAHCLRAFLAPGSILKEQSCTHYLLSHKPSNAREEENWFRLKPDLILEKEGKKSILDTKWKLLDAALATRNDKYGLNQNDFYQLFAYGLKYLNGEGHLMLIYPKHSGFLNPLPKFSFYGHLHLWVIPFDLDEKKLVKGDWQSVFNALERL